MAKKSDDFLFDNTENDELLFEDDELLFDDDELFIFDNESPDNRESTEERWNVLVVDDEEEVHKVTNMVLENFKFDNKNLNIISAYSAEKAKECLEKNEIALLFLDVVMEEDDSGLKLVRYIREELNNNFTRIVLRTGQPGQAPEEDVIMNYDINDYKAKTELTAQKLFTVTVSSLRSYRDIKTIYNNRVELEKIIDASANIFEIHSFKNFSINVLNQINTLISNSNNSIFFIIKNNKGVEDYNILSATGRYKECVGKKSCDVLPEDICKDIKNVSIEKKNTVVDNKYIMYLESKNFIRSIVYVEDTFNFDKWQLNLMELFGSNISIAYDNVILNREIEDTQKEIIFTLGEIAEARSKETSNHVKRVAEYSKILALGYGLSEEEAELIRISSPMHDIGKLGVPDAVLNKPGRYTNEEFDVMKKHSEIGYEMIKNSSRKIIRTASIIAYSHHEKYNGKGYPLGLKGEEIHLYGRITAIADVFDALGSKRVYKDAWPLEKILKLFKEEKGEHFDPKLVDIFFENLDEILEIRDKLQL